VGSNDVTSWQRYATAIDSIGLVDVYRTRPLFNHPPLMGHLAWLCHRIAEAAGLPFSIVFRLPSVAANVGTAFLLLKIWQARGADEVAGRAFARYSWSVCAILVGAYHGNTDCLAVLACMACLYLLEMGKPPWLAGLALGAAVNVKVIPVLAFLPLLAAQRTRRSADALAIGALLGALPFAVAWLGAGDDLILNVFRYRSSAELWGLPALLEALGAIPGVGADTANALRLVYREAIGQGLVLGSVVLLAVYGYRAGLGAARLMAATFCLFLIFAPGFGVQYAVYLVAPALAVSPSWGRRYDLVAGLFILLTYLHFRQGAFPLRSFHGGRFPPPSLRSVSRRGCWRSQSCGRAFARSPARPITRRLPRPYGTGADLRTEIVGHRAGGEVG
jgi:hypothetical protein